MQSSKLVIPEKGTAVEILIDGGAAEGHYLSEVIEETEKGLVLSGFESGGVKSIPSIDTPLTVRFHKSDAGYEFESLVLTKKEKPFKFCYIAKPVTMTRRQLRAYLRIDCEIPVSVIRQDDRRRNVITGTVTNISGGGCVILLPTAVPPDVITELKFELDEGRVIDGLIARVLTRRQGEDGGKQHVMQFETIDDDTRTAIIQYTFRLQHKQVKKAEKADQKTDAEANEEDSGVDGGKA